ncbi:MAG: hypothetical protein KGL53_01055, partial [Elusimicrobia bacterium]|nr:hypothetical protein [Elusimicrobiota bacterium]
MRTAASGALLLVLTGAFAGAQEVARVPVEGPVAPRLAAPLSLPSAPLAPASASLLPSELPSLSLARAGAAAALPTP